MSKWMKAIACVGIVCMAVPAFGATVNIAVTDTSGTLLTDAKLGITSVKPVASQSGQWAVDAAVGKMVVYVEHPLLGQTAVDIAVTAEENFVVIRLDGNGAVARSVSPAQWPQNVSTAAVATKVPATTPVSAPDPAALTRFSPAANPPPSAPLQGGDTCATATPIASIPASVTGTTSGYLNDYDEACPYTGSTSPDVVYSYTPAANITVDLTLCVGNTDYDTKMYIYEDTCASPYFACNDDSCSSPVFSSYVSALSNVAMAAGHTYYIVIDGYGGDFGTYYLDISVPPPPGDDTQCPDGTLFGQPVTLSSGGWTFGVADTDFTTGPIERFENYSGVAGPICDLHWWGLKLLPGFTGPCDEAMDFNIRFYADNGGVPGAQVCQYTLNDLPGVPYSQVYVGFQGTR